MVYVVVGVSTRCDSMYGGDVRKGGGRSVG